MCGIAGIIWNENRRPRDVAGLVERLGHSLRHRGPDGDGSHLGLGFAVAHRRLAIIDKALGAQPMYLDDGRLGIVYNGEVYNFQTLRAELEAKGHRFKTSSDTEVVLAAFQEWGVDSFRRLEGMFALFIWDFRRSAEGEFYLARDQLGIKPLYVYRDAERILFASELRTLLALPELDLDLTLEPVGFQRYFAYRYGTAPTTFFKRIARLDAGCCLRIKGLQPYAIRYWDIDPTVRPARRRSLEDAAAELRSILLDNVRRHLISEVPVGTLLSGGIDSSVVTALIAESGASLKSFNIGFPEVNEFEYSRIVAKAFGQDHIEIETSVEEMIEAFDEVVWREDEPIADPACFPLHVLAREIRRHVTVVLSGEGSDEMLAGYPQYERTLAKCPLSPSELYDAFLAHSYYYADRAPPLVPPLDPGRLKNQQAYFLENSPLNGMMAFDLKTWLPENLMMKADKIMMSHSLEGRFPFITPRLVEFAMGLPDELKLDGAIGKRVLRAAFADRLPKAILERPKRGFSVPLDLMVAAQKDRLYDLCDRLETTELAQVVDAGAIRASADDHFAGRAQSTLWLWTSLMLLAWFDRLAVVRREGAAAAVGARPSLVPALPA